jgi:DoxX-like family
MNMFLANFSIPLLRWTLGLVVILESILFAFSPSAAHFLVKAGLPSWIQTVLGGAEILAAVLFLVPLTIAIGGYFLLVIFAFAILLHILHGQYQVGELFVYATAVIVCMAHSQNRKPEVGLERS